MSAVGEPPRTKRSVRSFWRWVALGAGVLLLLLVLAILHRAIDLMQGVPVKGVQGGIVAGSSTPAVPALGTERYREIVETLTQHRLRRGNAVEVLTSGSETYSRLWDDLREAEKSITIQMYYCSAGTVADSLKRILGERRRSGVPVLFLWDGFGCRGMGSRYWKALQEAGIETAEFRPIHWYSLHKAQHRSHVRAVVIDGQVGYTGGFGIDDKWVSTPESPTEWKEINARFTGPAVLDLQGAFASAWAEATGRMLVGDEFFHFLPERPVGWGGARADSLESLPLAGEPAEVAMLLHTKPSLGSTVAERMLALSLLGAREKLYITSPYFVPDAEFRRFLREAAGRGVDVRILTAGPRIDVKIARLAGRYHYEELLRSGVRIFEYSPTMMHGKALVGDGKWVILGTLNFDNRSLRLNEESSLVVSSGRLGREMEDLFLRDLQDSNEISLQEMQGEPLWTNLLEWGASRLWMFL